MQVAVGIKAMHVHTVDEGTERRASASTWRERVVRNGWGRLLRRQEQQDEQQRGDPRRAWARRRVVATSHRVVSFGLVAGDAAVCTAMTRDRR